MRRAALRAVVLTVALPWLGLSQARAWELGPPAAAAETLKQAKRLLKQGRYAEAAEAAREYLHHQPQGAAEDDMRVVLCRARTDGHLPDLSHSPGALAEVKEAAKSGTKIVAPQPLVSPLPEYPDTSRYALGQGSVVMEAFIDEEGCVVDAKVLRGMAEKFNQKALDSLRHAVFRPATQDGKPVHVYYSTTVTFSKGY
ncbi:MAG TPA: energy transducer TonB [Thermoanaerobaculia bacterium]|nr:energy transducer TonB [Thermoanaerobaculia bacterium]